MPPIQSDAVASGEQEPWPAPIHDRGWTDADGTRWQLCGAGRVASVKRIKKLLLSPEVGVLLFDGPDAPSEVGPDGRQALWQQIRPHLTGTVVRDKNDYTDFRAAEFKDDQRRRLVIVERSC